MALLLLSVMAAVATGCRTLPVLLVGLLVLLVAGSRWHCLVVVGPVILLAVMVVGPVSPAVW